MTAQAARKAAPNAIRPNPIRILGRSTLAAISMVGSVGVFAVRGVAARLTAPLLLCLLQGQVAQCVILLSQSKDFVMVIPLPLDLKQGLAMV